MVPLVLVMSCSPPATRPPGPPVFTNFGFTSGRVMMRPGNCASNAINIGSRPQLTLSELELTIDGPGKLTGVEDVGGLIKLAICSSLKTGAGKVKVAVKEWPDYFVTADYSIGRPDVDPLELLEPRQVLGRMGAVPTVVQWSADASKLYVSWDTGVFTELSAATLLPLRSWVGLGTRTRLISPGRVVSDGKAAYLFDLDAQRASTWVAGPSLGWETSTLDTVSDAQTRGATGAGDLLVIADRSMGGCGVGTVDLRTGEHHVHEFVAGNDNLAVSAFDPLATYLDVSPNGRFVASAAESFCGHEDYGPAIVYDRQNDTWASCGFRNSALSPAVTTGTAFSTDGTLFGWVQSRGGEGSLHLMTLPGCTPSAFGVDAPVLHHNLAVSPDGTKVAYINDLVDTTLGALVHSVHSIDVTPGSARRHGPDASGATLTLASSTPKVTLNPGSPNLDAWSKRHHALSYSPDGTKLAVALLGGALAIIDVESGTARVDPQLPFVGQTVRERRVSPDGKWLVMGAQAQLGAPGFEVAVDLADGRVVYRATGLEQVVDAQNDGFILEDAGSHARVKVDYATLARTPIATATLPVIDRTSPNHTRRCAQRNMQLCIVDVATDANVHCAPWPIPSGQLGFEGYALMMLSETECVFSANKALYKFTGPTGQLTRLAPDPAVGAAASAALFKGPTTRDVISVDRQVTTWRIP